MDFAISEKMQTVIGMINEFVDRELLPLESVFLKGRFDELVPALDHRRQMVKQMELWAPNQPVEYGGMGLNLVEHALVSEALGRSPLGHYAFGCQAPDAGNAEILHLHGTPAQKEKYLQPLVDGRIRSCFSMTEVEMPGSNPLMLETTAVKDGNDYIINGQKWYTTASDGAAFAIVMALTNPEDPPYLRASMIIVPTDAPGFNQVRIIPVMGEVGRGYFSHSEILYQSCRVPQENLLGPAGHGFIIAQEGLGPGRIHHCMRWIG
ncbi:MAG: acyl-CoA dehydrogenase family protein, partial [Desulfosarcina sp.]|nr:acyl-CoA dehydrogenase family protein [Desulfobacterales bacterium]